METAAFMNIAYSYKTEQSLEKSNLLKESPADQCKCIVHENVINKLKALSILYNSNSFQNTVLCNNTTNLQF